MVENNTSFLDMEKFTAFLKQKGFLYPSSEIYGGISGVYEYGHTGCALKNNWCNLWKNYFLNLNDNFVEIETANIMHENVFKASGHLENFFDPIAHCSKCDATFRADHLIEDKLNIRAEGLTESDLLKLIQENNILCQKCNSEISKVEQLNMMFPVDMGPKKGTRAYLRPETAQSPFVNFKTQFELLRKKLPLGLACIGRVFRNEISPRNLTLRSREFQQAELQIFFNPEKINDHEDFDSIKDYELQIMFGDKRDQPVQLIKASDLLDKLPKFYVYHMAKVQQFYFDVLNIDKSRFRLYQLIGDEKAFYNKYHFDIELKMNNPDSWVEIGGIHYRTDHDLSGHAKVSKVNLEVFDESTKTKFIPHVLELSFGLDRNLYGQLDNNCIVDENRGNINLALNPKLSPYKVAILPLLNKDEIVSFAQKLKTKLSEDEIKVVYDRSGSIGKRYARYDEVGTPYCITVDFDSVGKAKDESKIEELKDTVTIRDRDTTKQKRISIDNLSKTIKDLVKGKITFDEL